MTDATMLAAASSMSTYLLGKYGATMCSDDLAEQLHTTPLAIRVGLCRGIDLPLPEHDFPGRGHRWLTTKVANWLAGQRDEPPEIDELSAFQFRQLGRPRKPAKHVGGDV